MFTVHVDLVDNLRFWETSKMYTLRLFSLLITKVVYVASVIRPLPSWIETDDTTCLTVQKASIRNAFSQMVDIAEAAYDRTTMARVPGASQPGTDAVIKTISTYFAPSRLGAEERVMRLIGKRTWMAVFGIMQLTS